MWSSLGALWLWPCTRLGLFHTPETKESYWSCISFTFQFEDEQTAEDFKVRSFIAMVTGCQKIGVPYSDTGKTDSI